MRMRTAVVTLGTVLAGAVLGTTFAAGPAAAFRPVTSPQDGIIIGVSLNHDETAAIGNTPVPALLDHTLPNAEYQVDPKTQLRREDGKVYSDLPGVWHEAAQAPDGRMAVAILNPAMFNGHAAAVVQALH